MDNEWMEVGSGDAWDGSAPVQGIYISKQENVGPNNSMMYTLQTSEGNVSIWGSTTIDQKFAQLHFGQEVRVEFLGLSEKKGKFGKPWKEYSVKAKPLASQARTEAETDPGISLDELNY